jgi:hypothetical protein
VTVLNELWSITMQVHLPADLLAIVLEMSRTFDISPEQAVVYALREWALEQGLLELQSSVNEHSPTEGNA